jgi:hypothetical protein
MASGIEKECKISTQALIIFALNEFPFTLSRPLMDRQQSIIETKYNRKNESVIKRVSIKLLQCEIRIK